MTEHSFTRSVNEKLRAFGIYVLKLNCSFAKGVPDCWYSGSLADLWAEFKYIPKARKTLDPTKLLSAHQLEWLNARHGEGRDVAVIIGNPNGCLALDNGQWNEPQCFSASLSKEQIVSWIRQKVQKQ